MLYKYIPSKISGAMFPEFLNDHISNLSLNSPINTCHRNVFHSFTPFIHINSRSFTRVVLIRVITLLRRRRVNWYRTSLWSVRPVRTTFDSRRWGLVRYLPLLNRGVFGQLVYFNFNHYSHGTKMDDLSVGILENSAVFFKTILHNRPSPVVSSRGLILVILIYS